MKSDVLVYLIQWWAGTLYTPSIHLHSFLYSCIYIGNWWQPGIESRAKGGRWLGVYKRKDWKLSFCIHTTYLKKENTLVQNTGTHGENEECASMFLTRWGISLKIFQTNVFPFIMNKNVVICTFCLQNKISAKEQLEEDV